MTKAAALQATRTLDAGSAVAFPDHEGDGSNYAALCLATNSRTVETNSFGTSIPVSATNSQPQTYHKNRDGN
jgi:hypothetical protein